MRITPNEDASLQSRPVTFPIMTVLPYSETRRVLAIQPLGREWPRQTADGSQAGVLIAHRPNAVVPELPRLGAHFTNAQRFQFADLDALQDGVRPVTDVEPQATSG
jgi:hypothetical protein